MNRVIAYLWHRCAGAHWWRRARTAREQTRAAHARNLAFAQRARAHDAQAAALYPPPATGPPDPPEPAEGHHAPAPHDGP